MKRGVFESVETARLVPVVKLERAEDALPLAQALCRGGLPIAEITFRTEAAECAIRRIRSGCPEMLVGAGTIINREQAERAIRAGAEFLVSPGTDEEVLAYAKEQEIPVFPGACTPSEIMKALKYGIRTVKFFPASCYGGIRTIRALSGPFPQLRFMPTGGVNETNLQEYLSLDSVAACGGSWMVKEKLILEGRFDEIERLTAQAVALIKQMG